MPISDADFPWDSAKGRVMSVSMNPGVQALIVNHGFSRARINVNAFAQALERP